MMRRTYSLLLLLLEKWVVEAQGDIRFWADAFKATGVVPSRVDFVPMPLYVYLSPDQSSSLYPGSLIETGQMTRMPKLRWDCNPRKSYTVLLMDNDRTDEGKEFFNFLAYNVPGCNLAAGTVAFDYMEPASYSVTRDGYYIDEGSMRAVPFVFLVYEQPGIISINMKQHGCNHEMFNGVRESTSPSELQAQFNLAGPIAGNVIMNVYSHATEGLFCHYSQCIGGRWPKELVDIDSYCSDWSWNGTNLLVPTQMVVAALIMATRTPLFQL